MWWYFNKTCVFQSGYLMKRTLDHSMIYMRFTSDTQWLKKLPNAIWLSLNRHRMIFRGHFLVNTMQATHTTLSTEYTYHIVCPSCTCHTKHTIHLSPSCTSNKLYKRVDTIHTADTQNTIRIAAHTVNPFVNKVNDGLHSAICRSHSLLFKGSAMT